MDLDHPFVTLAIAVALGMLVGLQRERAPSSTHIGGVRTFPLVTLLGAGAGMLVPQLGPWLVAVAFLGVLAAGIVANVIGLRRGDPEPGMTTEVAMMVMFVVGVMLPLGMRDVAVAIGVGTTVLLQFKAPLHTLASRVGDPDFRAVLQFALITFIILPVLPDRTFGPFDVLNPYRIWLMVVLVVGISLAGYVAFRLLGRTRGSLAAGVIGGLISSTATTVSYARRARDAPQIARAATAIFLLATLVMYGRVIAEIRIVAPSHMRELALPIAIVGAVTLACAALSLRGAGGDGGEMPPQSNPAELKSALLFGGLYGLVLLLVAAAKHWLGEAGIYIVAAVSGLTDMDAITLSSGRLVERGRLEPDAAWRAIVLASISNLVFKTGIIWTLGGRSLALRAGAWFSAIAASGAALIFLWG